MITLEPVDNTAYDSAYDTILVWLDSYTTNEVSNYPEPELMLEAIQELAHESMATMHTDDISLTNLLDELELIQKLLPKD